MCRSSRFQVPISSRCSSAWALLVCAIFSSRLSRKHPASFLSMKSMPSGGPAARTPDSLARRARKHAQSAAYRDGRLPDQYGRHCLGCDEPCRYSRQGVDARRTFRPPNRGRSARCQGARGDFQCPSAAVEARPAARPFVLGAPDPPGSRVPISPMFATKRLLSLPATTRNSFRKRISSPPSTESSAVWNARTKSSPTKKSA